MKLRTLLLSLLLLLGAAPAAQTAAQPAPASTAHTASPQVVFIAYSLPSQLALAASRLDIWEAHPEAGWFLALATPQEQTWLEQNGFHLVVDTARTAWINAPPQYPCYRTIETLYTDLQARAAAYPGLASLSVIGYSYEARPIYALRLSSTLQSGEKPRFFLMANIHGREMITPETAMLFIDLLLDGYGVDPDITWLLDWHEVHVVVSANPDGHIRNETTAAYWRKNTQPYGSCAPDLIGVDLNRNHSFMWGGAGASINPCELTYRGPTAASESETQVIQAFAASQFPDQRGPEVDDPAPDDATGVLISLHSYSNLVLWPWGYTAALAPNAAQLQALGSKLATYNGYIAQQATSLYPTSGTTDDWSYGELGIASYTFEIGSSLDGFFPSCDRYHDLIQPNLAALLYAARVARTPYQTAFGPDALNLNLSAASVRVGQPVTLTAVINDLQNGGNSIGAAEAYLDLPPWAGGAPLSMSAADGAFSSASETVRVVLGTTGLPTGRRLLFVRGQDAAGHWGPVSAVFLEVQPAVVYTDSSYLPVIQR